MLGHLLHGAVDQTFGRVFDGVDDTGLKCGVNLAPGHRGGVGLDRLEGLHEDRDFGDANAKPLQVGRSVDGFFAGGDDPETGIAPAQHLDAQLGLHILGQRLARIAAEEAVEMRVIGKDERKVGKAVFRLPVGQRAHIRPDDVDRTKLHGFGGLPQTGDLGRGENLDLDRAAGAFGNQIRKAL